jgi:NAD(P)-dependent dehydrogenase (short-subunit alcohol dehydrogenase family)
MEMLKKLFSLEGKVVVITGGAQGIGEEVAKHIAAVGADIVILDIQEDKAKAVAEAITEEFKCRAIAIGCDVSKPEEVDMAIERADKEMGKLDLLFNNAGIVLHKAAIDVTPDEWLNVINVNLNGIFFVARAFGNISLTTINRVPSLIRHPCQEALLTSLRSRHRIILQKPVLSI